MTAPIQEPTSDRALQNFAFQRDQIFRRPAPVGGESLIPFFHAYQDSHFLTIDDDDETNLTFDTWNNYDTSVFDATVTGGLLDAVILLQPGLYSFTCMVEWATNWLGITWLSLLSDYDFSQGTSFHNQTGVATNPSVTFTLVMPAPFEPEPTDMAFLWQVRQDSGASRDTDFGTFIQAHYYGPVTSEISS